MKLAMFTNTYLPHVGGVANSVHTYEAEFRRRGWDVRIVAPEYEEAEESTAHVLRVPAIQNFNGSDFSLKLPQPWLVSDFMDQVQPDLIHSHHPFLLGDTALRTAYERNLPLVFTHHTMYEQYTHYVPLDSDAMKRVAIQMATEFSNLCHHVIAPSESVAELLRDRGVVVPVTTIPTGIDLQFFGGGNRNHCRAELGLADDALVVGHVGRLATEKNPVFLADAVGRFLNSNAHAVFLVVGDGSARQLMEQTLAASVNPKQIHFVGRQTGQQLANYYAAMDVFAFASQSETQGMVIAEALAAGNPVVALDGPGVREVVQNGCGCLLPGDASVDDFTAALQQLTQSSQHLQELSRAATDAVKPYGLEACADRLAELYRAVVQDFRRDHGAEFGNWEQLQGRMEAEWKLLVEKANALSAAVADTEATRAIIH